MPIAAEVGNGFVAASVSVERIKVDLLAEQLLASVSLDPYASHKIFTDLLNADDALAWQLAKAFADTATATDAIAALQVGKGLSDTIAASDALSILVAFSRSLADTATASDAGLLRMQDYAEDYTYFAEDYVGISRTF